jgi:mannose-6-phosphate isomerase-like protein (cupin superfamily)
MKVIRSTSLSFLPVSHEDPKNPGAFKKILLKSSDLSDGVIQVINWAKIPKGKALRSHYHESMEEIYIIVSGRIEMTIDHQTEILQKGDTVVIPAGSVHVAKNISPVQTEYITIGIVKKQGGKTILV